MTYTVYSEKGYMRYELGEVEMLIYRDDSLDGRVAYKDIGKINLNKTMEGWKTVHYMVIETKKKKLYKISEQSKHFEGIEQKKAYYIFLYKLHRKLLGFKDNITFSTGSNGAYYFALICIPLVFILMLFTVLSFQKLFFSWIVAVPLLLYSFKTMISAGQRRRYSPDYIPKRFLPDIEVSKDELK